ncbi:hypothetical protein [Chelativorans sp. Marseille-P2723]|uniref:hypothetical protein n=1 Tax=Chelativorans sp. Marseille-P2723 TaxID=2709133 RepID=UPI00156DB3B9|nr:hypothetical protein [Chelativorans sp. Marseille-P2723]
MGITADVLLMLTAFSLKTKFFAKAIIYGRAGVALYPEDNRFREALAYGLLLEGETEEAAAVVSTIHRQTRNLAYLKAQLAMNEGHSEPERQEALRTYLRGR